jgi:hypothetical protein
MEAHERLVLRYGAGGTWREQRICRLCYPSSLAALAKTMQPYGPPMREPMTPVESGVSRPRRRYLTAYLLTFSALLAVFLGAGMGFPRSRDLLCSEDGPIETLTVLVLLAGGAVSATSAIIARRRRQATALSWTVAALCGFGALEELSYGRRIVPGLPVPIVLGVEVDALHDFADVAKIALRKWGTRVELVALLSLGLCLTVWAAWRLMRTFPRQLSREDPRPALLGLAVMIGLAAVALDAFRLSMFLEETLELEAAVALLFAALAGVNVLCRSERGSATSAADDPD